MSLSWVLGRAPSCRASLPGASEASKAARTARLCTRPYDVMKPWQTRTSGMPAVLRERARRGSKRVIVEWARAERSTRLCRYSGGAQFVRSRIMGWPGASETHAGGYCF
jgi:hypothetical protein